MQEYWLDIDENIQEKLETNNEKYPVEKAKGKSDKYSMLGEDNDKRGNGNN